MACSQARYIYRWGNGAGQGDHKISCLRLLFSWLQNSNKKASLRLFDSVLQKSMLLLFHDQAELNSQRKWNCIKYNRIYDNCRLFYIIVSKQILPERCKVKPPPLGVALVHTPPPRKLAKR